MPGKENLIPREKYAWYKEGIDWEGDEGWFKLNEPGKYLKPDESSLCKCSHHVKDHGYSCIFGEEIFCSHKYGDEGYRPIFVDYDGNKINVSKDYAKSHKERGLRRCPCEGFEPYKIKEVI